VFDYIPFPVFTYTTGMTHFQASQGVMSRKEAGNNPGLCLVKGE